MVRRLPTSLTLLLILVALCNSSKLLRVLRSSFMYIIYLFIYLFIFKGTAGSKSDDETKSAEDTEVYCCDPRRWPSALVVLGLICLLSFGSYYCYDNPVALQNIIINVMKVDFTRYNLLYSLYSWPNVILALVGGVLMDRVFGVRLGTVIFSSFICLGQVSHSNIDFTSGV